MARTLTAARAMVRPEDERQYLTLLAERASAAQRRGARFWVFRNRSTPGAFLEFTESAGGDAGARSIEEIEIERRMRDIALYGPDAEEVWEEAALPSTQPE
jgi:tryptophan 2,3-dioxygenase